MRLLPQLLALSVALILLAATGAADAADRSAKPAAASPGPQTLTRDWFGHGPAMRKAGLDLRIEWTQFYQGLTQGDGAPAWAYGGKWDAAARVDLAKLGLWQGLSLTAEGYFNYGRSVNGTAGTFIPVNVAMFVPGASRSDVAELYLTQALGDRVALDIGKLNALELVRPRTLVGGGGVDTFWNTEIAAPATGNFPATLNGALLHINTQPTMFLAAVFDPVDATNRRLFSDLFANGVSVLGLAIHTAQLAGRTGYYWLTGIYSTRQGPDFTSGTGALRKGSYYVGVSWHQYLVQDQRDPTHGWGVFGQLGKGDANPNPLDWSIYAGLGGNGLLPSRPDDRFGIAYFHYGFSPLLKMSLAPGFNMTDETGLEAFYNFAVTPWLRVAADVQLIRPAARDLPRAVYAGVSTSVKF